MKGNDYESLVFYIPDSVRPVYGDLFAFPPPISPVDEFVGVASPDPMDSRTPESYNSRLVLQVLG
jgi:hypothetical protein